MNNTPKKMKCKYREQIYRRKDIKKDTEVKTENRYTEAKTEKKIQKQEQRTEIQKQTPRTEIQRHRQKQRGKLNVETQTDMYGYAESGKKIYKHKYEHQSELDE